jgi:glycosyltransferase involved in cell wall biosynthesis
VEGRTIGSVIKEHRLPPPDMLFLDVQGAEYRILSAIPEEVFKTTKLVYTEVSKEEIYKGSRPLNDIIALLAPQFLFAGFAPLMQISPTHGNALFVNRRNAALLEQPEKPGWVPAAAAALNEKGEALFGAGDTGGAEKIFSALAGRFPEYPSANNNLGVVLSGKGEHDRAFDLFLRALETDPQHESALLNAFDAIRHCANPGYETLERAAYDFLDEHLYSREILSRLIPMQEAMYRQWLSKSAVSDQNYRARPYLVSAVVSSYKSEAFMAECLTDLTSQTIGENLEIIVIEAASPQNEGAIVKDFQKRVSNIRYVRTAERIGIYPAWNLGIFLACGEFITPFSTNDRLRPDAYEIMLRHMQQRPKVALVYGDTYLTDLPHQRFDKFVPKKNNFNFVWPPFRFEQLLFNCLIGPHPVWRRSLHPTVGYFDPRYSAIADQDFWLRVGKFHPIEHIPEFTGLQWLSEDSLSGKATGQKEVFDIQRKHQKAWLAERRADYTPQQLDIVLKLFIFILTRLLETKNLDEAVAFWERHFMTFPPLPEVEEMAKMMVRLRQIISKSR